MGKTKLRSNLQRLVDLGIVEAGKEGNGRGMGGLGVGVPVLVEAVVEWVEGQSV